MSRSSFRCNQTGGGRLIGAAAQGESVMIGTKTALAGLLGLAFVCSFASQALAQAPGEAVSASKPAGLAATLRKMGFSPELTTDQVGDPLIISRANGGVFSVIFFGCNEATHDACQSIRMQVGFDRAKPWTAAEAMQLTSEYRFLGVRLDEDGDPYVHWDLHLGEGIPEAVFMQNVRAFEQSVTLAAEIVYAEEMAAAAK